MINKNENMGCLRLFKECSESWLKPDCLRTIRKSFVLDAKMKKKTSN